MLPDSLRTPRLLLRPIAAQDAGPIFERYAQDPDVSRFLTWRPHHSRADTDAYIGHCLATPPETARTYVLVDGENRVCGALDLRHASGYRLEFGYVLARSWWGRGLMTEALTEAVAWALAQPPIFRIGSVCDVDNIASARVMEKSGLTREGRLHRWLIHPNISDKPRDCFVYARTRPAP
jgi:ribosomal-protein-alanine N-acetyltransferase